MKEKSSKLSQIFESESQNLYDKDGRIFLDFDGDVFVHVLNYLRNGSIPPKERVLQVHECAEYFGITSLVEILNSYCPVARKIKISEMRQTFDTMKYEELKRIAIADLNTNFQTNVDKYFVFDGSEDLCYPSTRNGITYVHSLNKTFYTPLPFYRDKPVRQVVHFPGSVNVEMMICLGHELCELGFGNNSFYKYESYNLGLNCRSCGSAKFHEIILTEKQPTDTKLENKNILNTAIGF